MIDNLHELVQNIENGWGNHRLLIVGDVMLDKYIWGEVGRISPEAPVPVVRRTHETAQAGGAANVAVNVSRLGAVAEIVGFIGSDIDGQVLTDRLQDAGIIPHLITSEGFPTITKTRVMGGRQQMLRLDTERSDRRSRADCMRLVETALNLVPGCRAVILSDYAKGTLTAEICQAIVQRAREFRIPVLVDPKSADFARYRGATTVCPNLAELSSTLQMSSRDLDALLFSAEKLVDDLDLEFLTATLSEKGIALLRRGQRFMAPASARQVFDVSGAGDTVIAVLALCLACNVSPEVGIQLANLAAGIVVGKVGTVPVEKHELMAALVPDLGLDASEKVVTPDELLQRIALWRANGDQIVFTNGCFDLLHVGHIAVLEQARRFGDRLVVGLNSDNSVRGLKGSSRPIVGERERARILAALSAVDAVVLFDGSTPLELITTIRPDFLVKGGDYSAESVIGAREMRAWGGQVKIIPSLNGHSTTNLARKMMGDVNE